MSSEIKIKEKRYKNKRVMIIECQDVHLLLDYVRLYYMKTRKWTIQENSHLVGWLNKRYRIVLREL